MFYSYRVKINQNSLACMCDQDKAFFDVDDKQYDSRKKNDPIQKIVRMVDKILEDVKTKGQMIVEEEALLRKKEKYGANPKLLLDATKIEAKGQVDDRIVFDKDIAYMKELEKRLIIEEKNIKKGAREERCCISKAA